MSLIFVDAYGLALKALDPAAWELFCALEDRILHSTAYLLSHAELTALRPAVTDSTATVSPTAALCVQPSVQSVVRDADAMGTALVASHVLQYLRGTLQAGILHTFTQKLDASATLASAQLAKDLSRVRQQVLSAQSSSSSPCYPGLVLTELSAFCQSILVLSALWMSTKFWATLSESSTLSGLVACFLRLSMPPSKDRVVDVSDLEGDFLEPRTSDALGTCTGGALDAVPMEQANVDALCLASTPPSSPLAPVPQEHRSCAEMSSIRIGSAGGREGGADGYDPISSDLLTHLMCLDNGVAEVAESLARAVEDTEIILLRCSGYTIPI
ncbi:conserved hypothetical protein [Leishmania braziliensis MHOM/BR/75/M2904]|uniref:Uncharacterized protein n=2 Tax=Leishmania braziliensis TaxID=5660 RepID=A4H6N6_LEIBR|nr:conserved hypothetical protein [Leishmania braziliensis MHOM/BR/75/M2904]KAI5690814.1 hypothetical protein MNV84_01435 [Leishmania braziliensis]CAJ2468102.1 unnamed protein product [Leishmania braziliensis]CAM41990.1 conserved hypothetical protein [Leishmania braziliensis MHOM/BR/75/M2904]SYZ63661.1 hypothetical_protein [Leishmania braziliensis MHOM/BR/75/M2904]